MGLDKENQLASSTSKISDQLIQSHAWKRLEDQLQWYDKKSKHCQRLYKGLKLIQFGLAVLIPVMSLLPIEFSEWAMALAGAVIALLEAIQHMNLVLHALDNLPFDGGTPQAREISFPLSRWAIPRTHGYRPADPAYRAS
jgi:hypothetical protein